MARNWKTGSVGRLIADRRGVGLWVLGLSSLAAACGDGNELPEGCGPGTDNCVCREDTSCDPGLLCSSDGLCVAAPASGGVPGSGGMPNTGGVPQAVGGTGGSPAVTCVGTATGTCADAACDTYPGCQVETASSCTGTAARCEAFDDDQNACTDQWGCGVGDNGLCNTLFTSCEDLSTKNGCDAFSACTWTGFACFGGSISGSCATRKSQSSCESHAACDWTGSAVDYCIGSATDCEAMTASSCATQQGCAVAPGACTGTPTPCTELSIGECGSQPGCQLSDGSSSQPTPTSYSGSFADFAFESVDVERRMVNDKDFLFVNFVMINRGSTGLGARDVRLFASTDGIFGNADDAALTTFPASARMEPFGLTKLSPGETFFKMESVSSLFDDGYYTVFVVLDYDDDVTEFDEENNIAQFDNLYFGPTVFDLTATSASHDGSGQLAPGDALKVEVTVENNSTTDVPTSVVGVWLSKDLEIGAGDIKVNCTQELDIALAPLQAKTFSLDCSAPRARGEYNLLVELDPADVWSDANRADNLVAAPTKLVVTAPSPELQVSAFVPESYTPDWRAELGLELTVSNTGPDPSPATSVDIYLQGSKGTTTLCTLSVSSLASGASVVLTPTCSLKSTLPGSYELRALVDPANAIFEVDDANNTRVAASPLVVQQPDMNLVASGIGLDNGPTFKNGESIEIRLTIENLGTDGTILPFDVDFYLSTDAVITKDDGNFCTSTRSALGPGQTLTALLQCPAPNLAEGDYYLGMIVDVDNELPETSESDNVAVDDFFQVKIRK